MASKTVRQHISSVHNGFRVNTRFLYINLCIVVDFGLRLSPQFRKEVLVSRINFPVSLPKASQGDSLAAFYGLDTEKFILL